MAEILVIRLVVKNLVFQFLCIFSICIGNGCVSNPKNLEASDSIRGAETNSDSSRKNDSTSDTAAIQDQKREIRKPDPKPDDSMFDGEDKMVETNKTILEGLWNFLEGLSKMFH